MAEPIYDDFEALCEYFTKNARYYMTDFERRCVRIARKVSTAVRSVDVSRAHPKRSSVAGVITIGIAPD